jgi:hypothetical protein
MASGDVSFLLVSVCGYKIWSLTLRDKRGLRTFRNFAFRITYEPKRKEVGNKRMEKIVLMRSFIIYTVQQLLFGLSDHGGLSVSYMRNLHTKF